MSTNPTLADAHLLRDAANHLVEQCLERAREITDGGKRIDDHQVLTERVTYAATQARAASELVDAVEAAAQGERATIGRTHLEPAATEQTFGDRSDNTLPGLELTLSDGRTVTVSGAIDRVDRL